MALYIGNFVGYANLNKFHHIQRIFPTNHILKQSVLKITCFFPFAEHIRRNLEPLRENIEKKKRAQDYYYESSVGVSPLRRDDRKPVKQRLGRVNIPYAGTSTSFLPPKQRLRKVNSTLNNKINLRKIRHNPAQQRLYRIRAQNEDDMFDHSHKKIKIRRPTGFTSVEPQNLQVEVVNNNANIPMRYQNINHPRPRRFKQILNTAIQMEIKKLQLQFTGSNDPPTQIKPAFTLKCLNDRFSRLK